MQRMTRQRAALIEALSQGRTFVSAQQLHEQLNAAGEKVSLPTVYRNLQELADAHTVDVLRTEDSDTQLFRLCGAEDHHHHLVCRNCGRTVEIRAADVEEWAQSIAANYGFTRVSHSIELYGLCAECSAKLQGK